MRLLCITPYPHRAADTRYRIEQFLPGLEQAGIHATVRPFMSERLFRIYAEPNMKWLKLGDTLEAMARRLWDVLKARQYDVIFLHKEAFMFGPPWLEHALRNRAGALVFDMDDAFWSHPPQFRQIGRSLRDPHKTDRILSMSDHVLAGNSLIADYVKKYNANITVFPTVIDTSRYQIKKTQNCSQITIGWVGRWSSSFYLDSLIDVFRKLCNHYPDVYIKLIGAGEVKWPGVRLIQQPWRLETELEDLQSLTIGIMPLVDDEYARYKCGFKLLQYMGVGIPSVASPVGVNSEIIGDGINGFLATTPTEWLNHLNHLIQDPSLRDRIGSEGRFTVESNYSLEKALPILIQVLRSVVKQ
jgi:glycosyltransferase involved in cell wall biosynthesis